MRTCLSFCVIVHSSVSPQSLRSQCPVIRWRLSYDQINTPLFLSNHNMISLVSCFQLAPVNANYRAICFPITVHCSRSCGVTFSENNIKTNLCHFKFEFSLNIRCFCVRDRNKLCMRLTAVEHLLSPRN